MKIRKEVFITDSFEETQRLGQEFAKDLRLHLRGAALNIALYGDLGSGKTTFVQGLAEGLGVRQRITSPTFIIVRSYGLKSQNAKVKSQSASWRTKVKSLSTFYHIDLYRIESDNDVRGLGLEEILGNPSNIVAIEWAEKMGDLLPKDRWDVTFEYVDWNKRRITIKNGRN